MYVNSSVFYCFKYEHFRIYNQGKTQGKLTNMPIFIGVLVSFLVVYMGCPCLWELGRGIEGKYCALYDV